MDFFVEGFMKLTVSIYTLKQLKQRLPYMECAILHHKDISLYYEDLDLDIAIKECLESYVSPILAIDKMLYPSTIDSIKSILSKYKKEALFLVTDIGVYSLAKEMDCLNRIIYDPQTMITNAFDLKEFSSLGFDSIGMSLEIPLEDVMESIRRTRASLFYQIFGHRLMFYSKRKLITLYETQAKISTSKKGLFLKESTREELLPIIENENGTIIYRSYLISLFNYIEQLEVLKYGYLESLYLEDTCFLEVLKIFYDVKNNVISKEEGKNRLGHLELDIKEGFTYQDSIYQKELF